MEAGMSWKARIYEDYFMPSRLGEYERLLKTALDKGYAHYTLPEFFNLVTTGKDPGKCFIHRHDIDTDVRTARKMFETEKKLGIKTSYYFRLNTLDFQLMKEIHAYGSEAGYHYEELAQYCKDHGIRSKEEIRQHYPQIRERFRANLKMFSKGCGFEVKTVASHGDFVNRKIGVANHDFVTRELMDETGIVFECYDERILKNLEIIISDAMYPVFYKPVNPFDVMNKGHKVIYLLTHPRHWHTAPVENTMDNLKRLWEGWRY
ncbi:MAG: hypothetical protein Fur0041_16130 [Bacteroidia bacterium]